MLPGMTVPVGSVAAGGSNVDRDGIDLDGQEEYIYRDTTGNSVGLTKWTIAFWIEWNGGGESQCAVLASYDIGGQRFAISIDYYGCLYIEAVFGGFYELYKQSDYYTVQYGELTFVMVSFDLTAPDVRIWVGQYGSSVQEITDWNDQDNELLTSHVFYHNYVDWIGVDWNEVYFFDGIVGDVYWISGQAITDPTQFAKDLGDGLKPVDYVGSYGSDGFHLVFSDNQNVCADSSGNGNNFESPQSEGEGSGQLWPYDYIGDMTNNGGLDAAFDEQTYSAYTSCAGGSTGAVRWVGGILDEPAAVGSAIVYGSYNAGFVTGSNPNVTLQLRASNSYPASYNSGTLLGSTTFTDTSNESGGRLINSNDQVSTWYYVWVAVITSTSTYKYVAELELFEPSGGGYLVDASDRIVGWLSGPGGEGGGGQ